MSARIVVGSRESKLAVVQSMTVVDHLRSVHPELEVELLTMKTTGDRILDRTLDKVGGKRLMSLKNAPHLGYSITHLK